MTDDTRTQTGLRDAAPSTAPGAPAASAAPDGSGDPTSPRRARGPRGVDARSVAHVAVFAALLVATAVVPGIPVGGLGVPITLQTLGVLLTGLVLGARRGALAVLVYLAIGLVGFPVFSKGQSGLQVLSGPTAGYLVSFLLAALVAGAGAAVVVRRTDRRWWVALLAAVAVVTSVAVIHVLGVAGLVVNLHLPLSAAVAADLPFLPGDLLKALVAAVAAAAVHRAFPDLLVRTRPGQRGA